MKPQPKSSTQEVLAGLVERVTYHNVDNGFCVLRAKARGHRDVVTVVGHAATIAAGEWVTASGEWVNDDQAITQLGAMLNGLVGAAEKKRLKLAPFIGIGCPGFIEEDGSIDRGAQNLPGNWESSKFNLPVALHDMVPSIGEHETSIVMHNDAVVQGLSEIPYMQDVAHWGVLTIGTGLGNARFTTRDRE